MFFSTRDCKKEPWVRPVGVKGFLVPLYLRSLPSIAMFIPVVIIHGVAVFCVFFSSLPALLQGLSSLLIAVSGLFSIRGVRARAGMQLVLNRRGDWFLIEAAGQSRSVNPTSGLILHANLVLLTVRDEDGKLFPFVFTLWNTDADTLRRLRVRLKATSY